MSLSNADEIALQRSLDKLQSERSSYDNPLDFFDGWYAAAEYYLEKLSAEFSLGASRLEKIEDLEEKITEIYDNIEARI
jgi:hypothetical protein